MRRFVVGFVILGVSTPAATATMANHCQAQRDALRAAASAVRTDASALGRLHSAEVRLVRSVAHYENEAYHLNSAISTHYDELGKAQAFLAARCSGPTDLNASAQACEN